MKQPTGRQILKALGPMWNRPLDREDADDKMADRVTQIPRKFKIVASYLPEYMAGGKSVLDVSCGAGVFLEIMRYFGNEIHGTCTNMFSMKASQEVPYTRWDSRNLPLPFADESYDLVSCFGSLKQYGDTRALIFRDLFRMARETVIVDVNSSESKRKFSGFLTSPPEGWKYEQLGAVTWKYTR